MRKKHRRSLKKKGHSIIALVAYQDLLTNFRHDKYTAREPKRRNRILFSLSRECPGCAQN